MLLFVPVFSKRGELLDQLLVNKEEIVLCGLSTTQLHLYGILELNQEGRAISLIEKPQSTQPHSNLKIEAAYLLNDQYLNLLATTLLAEYCFETALNTLMSQKSLKVVMLNQKLPSLQMAWHLFDYQRFLFEQLTSYQSPDANIANTAVLDDSSGLIYIEAKATIGHAVRIVGPAFIGYLLAIFV